MNDVTIRFAVPEDTELIYNFILQLAHYEKMSSKVSATPELLYESLFIKHQAEVLIAEVNHEPVAFALYFHNFSTFLGKANLYLEDLYVKEEMRGKGIGTKIFKRLAEIAIERNCERLDWWYLDWNEPSIKFYTERLHAAAMDEWTVYRICGSDLKKLAEDPSI